MKLLSLLALLSVFAVATPPMSFKGTVDVRGVWMDLNIPDGNGKVTGSYMYLDYGKPIALSGRRKGDSLYIKESVGRKATGYLRLQLLPMNSDWSSIRFSAFEKMSLGGYWSKPNGKAILEAWAHQVDPAYRTCALLDPDSLILADSGSFGNEIRNHEEDVHSNPDIEGKPNPRFFNISSCGQGFMSTYIEWTLVQQGHIGMEDGAARHVFDLSTRKAVVLADEIEPGRRAAFSAFMAGALKPMLEERWYADSTDRARPITPESRFEFHIDHETLMVGWTLSEPELDDESRVRLVEIYAPVPYRKLKPFLKKESVLHRLASAN